MLRYFTVMPPEPQNLRITKEEAAAGARAIVRLFHAWQLSDHEACQLLGGIDRVTWARWKDGRRMRISQDLATRLGLLLSINASLRSIYGTEPLSREWVKRPNSKFNSSTPLKIMTSGTILSIIEVRDWLARQIEIGNRQFERILS